MKNIVYTKLKIHTMYKTIKLYNKCANYLANELTYLTTPSWFIHFHGCAEDKQKLTATQYLLAERECSVFTSDHVASREYERKSVSMATACLDAPGWENQNALIEYIDLVEGSALHHECPGLQQA